MINLLHICIAVLAGIGGLLIVGWQLAFGFAYFHLQRKHPAYYKRIGQPISPLLGGYQQGDMARSVRGWNNTASWIDQGLPAGFPKDKTCRQLAKGFNYARGCFAKAMLIWGLSLVAVLLLMVRYNAFT